MSANIDQVDDGIFAFESLRLLVGDRLAKEFLFVHYELKGGGPGATDIKRDGLNIGDCDPVGTRL